MRCDATSVMSVRKLVEHTWYGVSSRDTYVLPTKAIEFTDSAGVALTAPATTRARWWIPPLTQRSGGDPGTENFWPKLFFSSFPCLLPCCLACPFDNFHVAPVVDCDGEGGESTLLDFARVTPGFSTDSVRQGKISMYTHVLCTGSQEAFEISLEKKGGIGGRNPLPILP